MVNISEPFRIINCDSYQLKFYKDAQFSPQTAPEGCYILTVMLDDEIGKLCHDILISPVSSDKYKFYTVRNAIRILKELRFDNEYMS